jgi:hypothetical protein
MPRNEAVQRAEVAGYHNNMLQFSRILEEARIERSTLDSAWHKGRKRSTSGDPCSCVRCVEGW